MKGNGRFFRGKRACHRHGNNKKPYFKLRLQPEGSLKYGSVRIGLGRTLIPAIPLLWPRWHVLRQARQVSCWLRHYLAHILTAGSACFGDDFLQGSFQFFGRHLLGQVCFHNLYLRQFCIGKVLAALLHVDFSGVLALLCQLLNDFQASASVRVSLAPGAVLASRNTS